MLPRLLRFLFAVLLLLSFSLPYAAAQKDITIERGVKGEDVASEKSSGSPAALPYFALILYSMLVLTIVCMPSRKA
jgi:hypothetical protein